MIDDEDNILINANNKKLTELSHIAQLQIKSEIILDFSLVINENGEKVLFIGKTSQAGEKSCYMLSPEDTMKLRDALNSEVYLSEQE